LRLTSHDQEFLKPLITPYEAYIALAKYAERRHPTQRAPPLIPVALAPLLARPPWHRNGISTGELVTDFQELRSVLHAAAAAAEVKAAQRAAGAATEDEEPSFSLIRQAYRTAPASAADAAAAADSTAVAVRPDGSALVHYTQRTQGPLAGRGRRHAQCSRPHCRAIDGLRPTDPADYLAKRSFRGLEQRLGETPVALAIEGREGIARGYTDEPQ